jgi:hypothetical protein
MADKWYPAVLTAFAAAKADKIAAGMEEKRGEEFVA